MAYKDKIKQREFQRRWAAKKRINKDGTKKLNNSYIFKEQLEPLKEIEKLKTWDECIQLASKFVVKKNTNRLEIATLAMKACELKLGGDRRTANYQEKMGTTLCAFAKEISLHRKTLHEWVRLKRFVDRSAPTDIKPVNLAIATHVMRWWAEEKYQEAYEYFEAHPNAYHASYSVRYLGSVLHSVKKYGLKSLHKDQKKDLANKWKELSPLIEEYLKDS